MNFLYKESESKKKYVSECFTTNQNLKRKYFFFFWGGGGGG